MLFTKRCQQSWSGVIISKSVESTSDKRMNARMIRPKGGEDAYLADDGTRGVMTWSRRSLSPPKNVHAAPRSQMSA